MNKVFGFCNSRSVAWGIRTFNLLLLLGGIDCPKLCGRRLIYWLLLLLIVAKPPAGTTAFGFDQFL